MLRSTLALALLWCIACSASAQVARERIALVIGNAGYKMAPLSNPRNDARAMAELLSSAGFAVDGQIDTDQRQLAIAVARFGQAIRDPAVKFALFYYAGHGVQLDWRNYLIPVDADIRSQGDVLSQSVDVSELLAYMAEPKGRSFLVILDACRDDPFAGAYRPPIKGLSQFDAPVGTLLAYATAPGNVALDGDGANGLYTSHLLREFAVRGAKLEDAFKRVRLGVRLASEGRQIPWESTSLEDDLYLFPSNRHKLSDAEQEQLLEQEIARWQSVKTSNDHLALVAFLRDFPSGSVSEIAQARLNRLLAAQQQRETSRMETVRQQLAQTESVRTEAERLERERQLAAQEAALALRRAEEAQIESARAAAAEALAQAQRAAAESARLAAEARAQERLQAQALAPVATPNLAATPYFKGASEHQRIYRPGDTFQFRVVDGFTSASKPLNLRVTRVDLEADRIEFNDGEYASDSMGNIVTNQRGVFSTPRQFYPAELFVGKKWRTMFKQSRSNGVNYTFRYEVKVVGKERVTVPAGTFEAFKIEARGFNLERGASLARNIWIVPGVAADIAHETIVRLRGGMIEQNDRQELVSLPRN